MINMLLITCAWTWGVHACFKKPFIFSPVAEWIDTTILPKWVMKPVYSCPVCMASVHGTAWYLYLPGTFSIIGWVTFCVTVAGINFIIKEHLYPDL